MEGQVNRLKFINRRGYGQASFALLKPDRYPWPHKNRLQNHRVGWRPFTKWSEEPDIYRFVSRPQVKKRYESGRSFLQCVCNGLFQRLDLPFCPCLPKPILPYRLPQSSHMTIIFLTFIGW